MATTTQPNEEPTESQAEAIEALRLKIGDPNISHELLLFLFELTLEIRALQEEVKNLSSKLRTHSHGYVPSPRY